MLTLLVVVMSAASVWDRLFRRRLPFLDARGWPRPVEVLFVITVPFAICARKCAKSFPLTLTTAQFVEFMLLATGSPRGYVVMELLYSLPYSYGVVCLSYFIYALLEATTSTRLPNGTAPSWLPSSKSTLRCLVFFGGLGGFNMIQNTVAGSFYTPLAEQTLVGDTYSAIMFSYWITCASLCTFCVIVIVGYSCLLVRVMVHQMVRDDSFRRIDIHRFLLSVSLTAVILFAHTVGCFIFVFGRFTIMTDPVGTVVFCAVYIHLPPLLAVLHQVGFFIHGYCIAPTTATGSKVSTETTPAATVAGGDTEPAKAGAADGAVELGVQESTDDA